MVFTLDPWGGDARVMKGRSIPNSEIGERMVTSLCLSMVRYDTEAKQGDTVLRSVTSLLKAAKKRARRTGLTVKDVLIEHRDALDERHREHSKFVGRTSDSRRGTDVDPRMLANLHAQDKRRAEAELSPLTLAAARAVEARESATMVVPYNGFDRFKQNDDGEWYATAEDAELLTVPTGVPAGVLAKPPGMHELGGVCPYADQLRLMAPPASCDGSQVLLLTYNPSTELEGVVKAGPPAPTRTQPKRTAALNVDYSDPDYDVCGPYVGGDRFKMRRI